MKKQFIESFVTAYGRNVACASDEAVMAFLQDFNADMGWEEMRNKHEYYSNIYDALGMFEAGMKFQQENEA